MKDFIISTDCKTLVQFVGDHPSVSLGRIIVSRKGKHGPAHESLGCVGEVKHMGEESVERRCSYMPLVLCSSVCVRHGACT